MKMGLWGFIFTGLISLNSFAGNEVGHGGDDDEILIHEIANQIYEHLKSDEGRKSFPHIEIQKFKSTLENAKVKVVTEDLFDEIGSRRTAINQPATQIIFVDRRLWGPIKMDAGVAVPLVFHEILGLQDVEVDNYRISSKIQKKSVDILAAATKSLNNLYFLTGAHLKNPIALYWSSVKFDDTGEFIAGIVARSSFIKTDQLSFIIYEGDEFEYFGPEYGYYNLLISGDIRPRKGEIRIFPQYGWQKLADNGDGNNSFAFRFNKDFRLRGASFVPEDFSRPWSFTIGGLEIYGVPNEFWLDPQTPDNVVRFTSAHFFDYNKTGFLNVHGNEISVHYVSEGSTDVFINGNGTANILPKGGTRPLRFYKDYLYLNASGEVTSGKLATGHIVQSGVALQLEGERLDFFEKGIAKVAEVSLLHAMPDSVGGVPILYFHSTEEKECLAAPFFGVSSERSRYTTVHFAGEKTFFDLRINDFVTLPPGSANIRDSLWCKVAESYQTFPSDAIIQPQ